MLGAEVVDTRSTMTRNMNIGNEALDRRNEIEMRWDKCSMFGAKWSG